MGAERAAAFRPRLFLPMQIRALGILEPASLQRRVYTGETVEVTAEEAKRYLNDGLAEAVASKPSERAEKRPKPKPETR